MTRPLLTCLVAALVLQGCLAHVQAEPPAGAIVHHVLTRDGWELTALEYAPRGAARGRPVLVCHGIFNNLKTVDLDARHSLPRWLSRHGRDAWVVSLRNLDRPAPSGRSEDFTFDTLAREDLPAVIGYIQAHTGAPRIDYVGHSLGGMLLYAYLAEGGKGVAAGVTLGSPTRLDFGSPWESLLLRLSGVVMRPKAPIRMALPARLFLPLEGLFPSPIDLLLYNPAQTKSGTIRDFMGVGISDLPGALGLQLLDLVRDGTFLSADGRQDYRRAMRSIRTPLLVVAGKLDRLAPPPAVMDGYRALGGPKEWLLLSEENGLSVDYGHMDMVLGERAAEEVWPQVLGFLDRSALPGTTLARHPEPGPTRAQ